MTANKRQTTLERDRVVELSWFANDAILTTVIFPIRKEVKKLKALKVARDEKSIYFYKEIVLNSDLSRHHSPHVLFFYTR